MSSAFNDVPWLSLSLAGLSLCTHEISPKSVHVGFVVDKVTPGEISIEDFDFLRQYHSSSERTCCSYQTEPDRQFTYNVTLRRVHETTLAIKNLSLSYFCVRACVRACRHGCTGAGMYLHACSLGNPVRKAPPYCHLWPLCLHQILWHSLVKCTATDHKMCILISSTSFILNISSFKNSAKYCHKCEHVFM
jgi:hypothetical protein